MTFKKLLPLALMASLILPLSAMAAITNTGPVGGASEFSGGGPGPVLLPESGDVPYETSDSSSAALKSDVPKPVSEFAKTNEKLRFRYKSCTVHDTVLFKPVAAVASSPICQQKKCDELVQDAWNQVSPKLSKECYAAITASANNG